jgi:hypothetical protein
MSNYSKKSFFLILLATVFLFSLVVLLVWQIREEKFKLTQAIIKVSAIDQFSVDGTTPVPAKLESQLAMLDNYFITADNTVEFLERLERTSNLTKVKIKINQAEAKNNLSLNFSLAGSFSAINQFLVLLEKFPYNLRIERLDLRLKSPGFWEGNVFLIATTKN